MNTKSSSNDSENTETEADELRRQVAELEKQVGNPSPAPAASRLSPEAQLMLRGSGLTDDSDVVWRISAGLLPAQAIQAALAQQAEDDRVAASVAKR